MPKRNELDDARFLLAKGYNIPKPLIDFIYKEKLKQEGVRQVWECPTKGCGKHQKMFVPATNVFCGCGAAMKLFVTL